MAAQPSFTLVGFEVLLRLGDGETSHSWPGSLEGALGCDHAYAERGLTAFDFYCQKFLLLPR